MMGFAPELESPHGYACSFSAGSDSSTGLP